MRHRGAAVAVGLALACVPIAGRSEAGVPVRDAALMRNATSPLNSTATGQHDEAARQRGPSCPARFRSKR